MNGAYTDINSTSVAIKESDSKATSSGFTIKGSDSIATSTGFTIKEPDSKATSSGFTIKESDSKATSSGFTVKVYCIKYKESGVFKPTFYYSPEVSNYLLQVGTRKEDREARNRKHLAIRHGLQLKDKRLARK